MDALHAADARRALEALAAGRDAAAREWGADGRAAPMLAERAGRAAAAVATRRLHAAGGLDDALADARALFDGGLYFEAHELLEPHWMAAGPAVRVALQGLIQVAVGYQHLANGNLGGARALLAGGSAKLGAGELGGLDLAAFASAVRATIAEIGEGFDWARAPRFPGPAAPP